MRQPNHINAVFHSLSGGIMSVTQHMLQSILPNARQQAGVFISSLNIAMGRFNINTPKRIAAFLAQVGHESGQFQ
jgi:putative chitinase